MSTLAGQLQKMEAHNSIFESAVRQLPLPVCAAFGAADGPQAVSFANSSRVLSTKDSDMEAAMPGRWAAPPAPAMITFKPRVWAVRA